MIGVGAMTEVEPERIDPCQEELLQHFGGRTRWPDGGDNLGSTVTTHGDEFPSCQTRPPGLFSAGQAAAAGDDLLPKSEGARAMRTVLRPFQPAQTAPPLLVALVMIARSKPDFNPGKLISRRKT
jgi:hypothetical protein